MGTTTLWKAGLKKEILVVLHEGVLQRSMDTFLFRVYSSQIIFPISSSCVSLRKSQISHQPANQQLFYRNSDTIWYHGTMHFFSSCFRLFCHCSWSRLPAVPMRGRMVYGGGIHWPVTKQTNNTKKIDIVLINQDNSHQGNRLKKKIPKNWGSKMSI